MKINPEHIKRAEEILIGGKEFDDERRKFINYFETIDLLAVPGSGKTTALLAKLYCIAQQMPFDGNRGILVLSHTNHAIEEIEKVLKPLCPQLFSYPNFVGTVQSFANKFIANQACHELYGSYITKNDDEMYLYEVEKYFNSLQWRKNPAALKNKLLGLVNRDFDGEFNEKVDNILKFLKSCVFDLELRKIKIGSQTKLKFDGVNKDYYLELENWKLNLLSQGVLSYRDSFDVSRRYLKLENSDSLKSILQHRFKFVFVDEMQDLDEAQSELIESIFFMENSDTVIQRIGDKNQAIYSNNSIGNETIWKTRNEIYPETYKENFSLNNSYRLTPTISRLVDGFVLERDESYKVIGISENKDIPPYLLIYDNESDAEKLKAKFIELIEEHELNQHAKNNKNGFHIIAWTTDKAEDSDKLYLRKLFPEYSKETKQRKEDFDCLRKYLTLFDREKNTFESVRKSLLNGIIRILRIEQFYFDAENKKHFRKSSFMQTVREQGEEYYRDFNQKLFHWCFSIVTDNNYEEIYTEYSKFIVDELKDLLTDFNISKSTNFINQSFDYSIPAVKVDKESKQNKIEIKLGSIHSVKGQTHCATMYVETDYHNCETHKLHVEIVKGTKKKEQAFGNNPLFFQEQNFSSLKKARSNETLKMMYVGFSRPTHLLCFAAKKVNIESNLEKYKESGWNVVYI
ncbi:UvrD-helicase domain-containing protein [Elizabethkingia anophelis]|uniref:UvrD-helicase domain-containing protein n=1 Tax=Elizabethkingia anophelis TaxID=1117645 RepID=UPI0037334D2A